ncbi:MAG: WYL domain-containing protein, partial [Actinobacteria bacterium]|nr:WYL domain-containing protein [Actinomycetota bacterium]
MAENPKGHSAGRPNEAAIANRIIVLFEYLRQKGAFDERSSDGDDTISIPLDDIAKQFDCTKAEAAKLAEKLSCCGQCDYLYVPVYVDEERDAVVSYGSFSALENPLRLSDAECSALLSALDRAGVRQDDPLRTQLLSNAASPIFESRVFEGSDPSVDTTDRITLGTTLSILTSAIENKHVVRMRYTKNGSGESETREVEPITITLENGMWYLHAFCRNRQSARVFSVENISEAEESDTDFETRSTEIRRFSELLDKDFPRARLRFEPGCIIEKREWPGLHIESVEPDGSTVANIPYADSNWLPLRIVSHLGAISVLEPEELKTAASKLAGKRREEAKKALIDWDSHPKEGALRCFDSAL